MIKIICETTWMVSLSYGMKSNGNKEGMEQGEMFMGSRDEVRLMCDKSCLSLSFPA
jgi:hypothetical protein